MDVNVSEDDLIPEGVVVISSDTKLSENLISKILGVKTLPEAVLHYNVKGYPWQFETKYYTAEINLYALEQKAPLDESFSNSIRATVFYFDGQKLSSFEEVLSWMPFLKDIDSDVQLLVCNNCSQEHVGSANHRKNILNWCVENQFELIELNPLDEGDDEDECIMKDDKGYARIVQALQAHTWANLIMKFDQSCKLAPKESAEDEISENNGVASVYATSKDSSSENASKDGGSKKIEVENEELVLEEKWLSSVLSGDDPDGESFESLFSNFASMKDRASGLTGDERKKYAEKVAIAFWRAMGGDEEEIDGLDDE